MLIYRLAFVLLSFIFQSVLAEDERFAFVSMYYPNAYKSQSDLIAIRTLYKSFLPIKSKAEFIVVSSDDISSSDKKIFESDGIKLITLKMQNAYKQGEIAADYQKTKNIAHLWSLKDYKRVIFVDAYTIFNYNIDSLFSCSYLCLRDEQPLVPLLFLFI